MTSPPHPPAAAFLDDDAVQSLRDERVTWRDKALPPRLWGRTIQQVVDEGLRLSALPTPLLTLSAGGVHHNVAILQTWCAARGLDLAPHGKTTMAPALWSQQIDAGAWGITLANPAQLAVARAFGVSQVMVANAVVSPLALRWIADELASHPDLDVLVWADAVRTVEIMQQALGEHRDAHPEVTFRPLDVLVELGSAGGRTGARDRATALDVARAVDRSPALRLAGVAGYEGALSHGTDDDSLQTVRGYLREMVGLVGDLSAADLLPDDGAPVVTAGGSAYFDVVADELGPLVAQGMRVVLRSGAYIAHDDGFYRQISPLGRHPRTDGGGLRPAIHGWVRVTSQPEPGLAIFDAGKRDLPFDEGLPEPQLLRSRQPGEPATPVEGLSVSALNDQHGFLRWDADRPAPVQIGDELRLGLSHPCTAFDKWGLVPVVDDPDSADPLVVDLVRTYF